MKGFNFSGIRFRLLLLVVLAVLPAFALTVYTASEQREQANSIARREALGLVRMASGEQEELISGARQLLELMVQLPDVRGGDTAACNRLFEKVLSQHPHYAAFGLIKPDGSVLSVPAASGPLNLADRNYFKKAVAIKQFAIGDYQINRITGKPTLTLACPVVDGDRAIAVLFTSIDLNWLNRLASKTDLPPGSSIVMIDRNGTVLSRYPNPEKWVGKTMPEVSIIKTVLSLQDEGTVMSTGLEGIGRDAGIFIYTGIPKDIIFAGANRILYRNLAAMGLFAVIAAFLAWFGGKLFFLQRIKALLETTRRLARGDLNARTELSYGGDELGQLSRAFDDMAVALEQRDLQLGEANARYRALVEQIPAITYISTAGSAIIIRYISPQIEKILGYKAAEFIDNPGMWLDKIVPEDRRQVLEQRQTFHASGKPLSSEYRMLASDNRVVWLHDEARAVSGANDGPQFMQGVILDITGHKEAVKHAQLRYERLQALRSIDLAITGSLDLRVTFNVILDQVTSQLGVDASSIMLLNSYTQYLEFSAGRGFRTAGIKNTVRRMGEGNPGNAAMLRQTIHIPNLQEARESFSRYELLQGEEFVAYYGVPLIAKGQVKGVLEIFHRSSLSPDQEWLEFLNTLAGQAAIAIENAWLFNDLQRSNVELTLAYDATIEGWARALDLRDRETKGHSRRVTEMTVCLGQAMGMSEAALAHVRRGALLHDIGKMGIPDHILLKPGPLTDEEWEVMRRHPVYAYEMLSPIAYLLPALDIPYCHHEKWDGSGYPRGLRGEQIPLSARIFALVDVWDALCSDRPYRRAWPKEKAREHIKSLAGTHFDRDVVELFLTMDW